jgi:hypothetical protein
MKTKFICLLFFALLPLISALCCTTIIVSGKATKDGRPLMWKNADTENPNHSVVYSDYTGYPLLAVIRTSSTDDNKASSWTGVNSEGFSIMNTLSYNLSEKPNSSRNGALMRKALEICKNVPDFKHYLDTLTRPLNVEANFGVIDAEGNAAYFETYSDGYRMLDVNDPAIAPNGYLVYTNFSYTGFYDKGQGHIRYQNAQHQVAKVLPSKDFSPQWILNHLARCYYHSLLDVDFTSEKAMNLFHGYIPDENLIARKSTASATVVQGVKKGENPELTTMWVALGYPPCSVAIPAWVKAGKDNPAILIRQPGAPVSKIGEMVLDLKANVYDVQKGQGEEYVNFAKVYNREGTGYMQKLAPIENYVFETVNPMLEKWREAGRVNTEEIKSLGQTISNYVEKSWPEKIK